MKHKIKHSLIYFLLLYNSIFSHSFHSSIFSFQYDSTSKAIEVSMKVFANDLEKAINQINESNFFIDSKKDENKIDSLIFDYIGKTIHLRINGKEYNANWVGKEFEGDIVWCYFEITDIVGNIMNISIENKFLFSSFEDQLNVLHFFMDSEKKTIMTHKDKTFDSISF